jgi:putative hemolysin
MPRIVDMSIQLNLQSQDMNSKFSVSFATQLAEIRQAQALRYQIFSAEMGAQLKSTIPNYDIDYFDSYCHHLVVHEKKSQRVVGYTRILTSEQAKLAGRFYSESEFDLSQIFKLSGCFMEIGRTCVHPDYRKGAIMGLLWSGLAHFMVTNHFEYLIGCASIPMRDDSYNIVFTKLQEHYSTSHDLRVIPKVPLQKAKTNVHSPLPIPSLLRAYLRLGAQIAGEPCWDPNFKVADVFILLSINNLQQRYLKHFINRAQVIHEIAA